MLGVEEPFLYSLVPSVVETMGDVYPELVGTQGRITAWIEQEEKQFAETLERSYGPFSDAIERTKAAGLKALPGDEVFRLYDTYGLPSDLAAEMAAECGLGVDWDGYHMKMIAQQEGGRMLAGRDFAGIARAGYSNLVGITDFVGYNTGAAEGIIKAILKPAQPQLLSAGDAPLAVSNRQAAEVLRQGEEGEVFVNRTPFYAQAGGQLGDRGAIEWDGESAEVLDVTYPVEGAHAHHVKVTLGELRVGQQVLLRVDTERRQAIARAHTATHLVHYALRETLGEHAVQSGSLVDADRLRFDFAHFSALTPEERDRIEARVVELALRDDRVVVDPEMDIEEARALGAMALFGEKYGERVRVVQIGDYSKELCGGTHLPRASAIGGFAIISEGSIGAGLRRMEAVTGKEAHSFAVRQRDLLHAVAQSLGAKPEDVPARIEALKAELRRAEQEIARMQQRSASALAADLTGQVVEVGGVKVLSARVERLGAEALRQLADQMLTRMGSGIVVLGCEIEGRAHFVAEVSKDLVEAGPAARPRAGYHAGNLVREVAKIAGGGGGGRPDFAQAGGKSPERLEEALARVKDLVAAQAK
jgi:alanyl-tRNA synthetase